MSPRFLRRLVTLLRSACSGAEEALRCTREGVRGGHGLPCGLAVVSGLTALFAEVVRALDAPSDTVWTEVRRDTIPLHQISRRFFIAAQRDGSKRWVGGMGAAGP